ncbi:diguanylate cyclase [archaeon]|nr:diguanylate cyclase [archaeon]
MSKLFSLRQERRKKNSGNQITLAALQLNEFNSLISGNGPEFVDSLLNEILSVARLNIRGGDIAKRFEQDKIILLLPGMESGNLGIVIDRIQKALEKKQFKGRSFNVNFAISFKQLTDIKPFLSEFSPAKQLATAVA